MARKNTKPALKQVAAELGRCGEFAAAVREVYQLTLVSLRRLPDSVPALRLGPYDDLPAARGAALFAARMAAGEIITERPSLWCGLIPLYAAGYWPCGLGDDGRLVVF